MILAESWLRYDYGSANVPELVWTLVSIVGLFLMVGEIRECVRDHAALLKMTDYREDGPRDIVAGVNIRAAIGGCVLQALWVVVGVFALLTPPAAGKSGPTAYGVAIALGFLAGNVVNVYNSYRNRGDRIRLLAAMRTRRRRGDTDQRGANRRTPQEDVHGD